MDTRSFVTILPISIGWTNHYVGRLQPLGTINHLERDLFAFAKRLESLTLDCGVVDKDVVLLTILRDEAISLRVVEPLYLPFSQSLHHLSRGRKLLREELPVRRTAVEECQVVPCPPVISHNKRFNLPVRGENKITKVLMQTARQRSIPQIIMLSRPLTCTTVNSVYLGKMSTRNRRAWRDRLKSCHVRRASGLFRAGR